MERTWRNFRRRRCCALCPGYGFVAPVSAAPPGEIYPTQQKTRTFRDGVLFKRKNKKPGLSTGLSALFDAWQFPTLTWGDPTLPSALRRFTSEFGMGSGGTTALVPPGKFFVLVLCLLRLYCVGCSRECQSHTYVCSFHRVVCRLVSAQNPSDSESELKILSNRQNIFGVVRLSLTVH